MSAPAEKIKLVQQAQTLRNDGVRGRANYDPMTPGDRRSARPRPSPIHFRSKHKNGRVASSSARTRACPATCSRTALASGICSNGRRRHAVRTIADAGIAFITSSDAR